MTADAIAKRVRGMKVFLQSEATECGLACLAMIADHHGQTGDLTLLRQKFSTSLKGVTLGRLISIAEQMGLQGRALRVDLNELSQLKLPAILHWDMNHFVVLEWVGKAKITVVDPAQGRRDLSTSDVSKHFTGVALELSSTKKFQRQAPPPAIAMRQLIGPIDGLWRSIGLVLLLSIALQAFTLLVPFYMQWVVDLALVSADHDLLTILGLGFGLSLFLQVAIGLLRGWSVTYLSSQLGLQWMGSVFAHALRLPLNFFEKRHLGDVVSRMGAVQAIQRILTTSFVESIVDGLMAGLTLLMMLIYSSKLALISLAALSIYLGLRAAAFRPARDITEQQLVAGAQQQSNLLETLRGMQSIKVAGCEALRQSSYQNLMVATVNQDLRLARLALGFNSTSQILFGVERIAVIWLGAVLVLDDVFSVGMLIAYLAYKDQFAARVSSLIDKWVEFRMLRLHGERLADIVLSPPEVDAAATGAVPTPSSSAIKATDLSFRYAEGEPWVLKDCDFSVNAGESVAIVGPSGCGKTTLLKVLLGLLPAEEGGISVGGLDIRRLGWRNYRAMVGVVMQDDQLFAGSIAENIALGDTEIDFERVQECARLAAIDVEIVAMPMGYYSLIGDMGTSLSGGQKQRIILARAFYRRPNILFLDEATSHLDVDCERAVNDAVRTLKLTRIIIAHRPETVASADRVVLMRDGKLMPA